MSNTINREQIKQKFENNESFILVEALPKQYFEEWHILGAINIPHDETQNKATDMLPEKDALIITYCANTDCQNSQIAANSLECMGFTNVFEYVEGKADWKDAGLPIQK